MYIFSKISKLFWISKWQLYFIYIFIYLVNLVFHSKVGVIFELNCPSEQNVHFIYLFIYFTLLDWISWHKFWDWCSMIWNLKCSWHGELSWTTQWWIRFTPLKWDSWRLLRRLRTCLESIRYRTEYSALSLAWWSEFKIERQDVEWLLFGLTEIVKSLIRPVERLHSQWRDRGLRTWLDLTRQVQWPALLIGLVEG